MHLQWRAIHSTAYASLHSRQLVSPGRVDGYLVPPCDRITGRTLVVNETDAYLPRAPVAELAAAWYGARQIAG
jgi:hypothetical protein